MKRGQFSSVGFSYIPSFWSIQRKLSSSQNFLTSEITVHWKFSGRKDNQTQYTGSRHRCKEVLEEWIHHILIIKLLHCFSAFDCVKDIHQYNFFRRPYLSCLPKLWISFLYSRTQKIFICTVLYNIYRVSHKSVLTLKINYKKTDVKEVVFIRGLLDFLSTRFQTVSLNFQLGGKHWF